MILVYHHHQYVVCGSSCIYLSCETLVAYSVGSVLVVALPVIWLSGRNGNDMNVNILLRIQVTLHSFINSCSLVPHSKQHVTWTV